MAASSPSISQRTSKAQLCLILLWCLVQLGILATYGIRHGHDTTIFSRAGEAIVTGQPINPRVKMYMGFNLWLAAFRWTGLGEWALVLAQVALSGLAARCLYSMANRFHRPPAGAAAVALFVLFLDIQRRNFYLLTTSIYISMSIVAFYLVLTCRSRRRAFLAAMAVLYTALCRPEGFFVPLAIACYILVHLWAARRYRLLAFLFASAALLFPSLHWWAKEAASPEKPLRHFESGTVIWGYRASSLDMHLTVPEDLRQGNRYFAGLLWMMRTQPRQFFRLIGTRLADFLAHVKPYYSRLHNGYIALVLYPAYLLAFLALYRRVGSLDQKALYLSYIALYGLMVALMFEDWHGRWLWHVLPFVFIFSGAGFAELMAWLFRASCEATENQSIPSL